MLMLFLRDAADRRQLIVSPCAYQTEGLPNNYPRITQG